MINAYIESNNEEIDKLTAELNEANSNLEDLDARHYNLVTGLKHLLKDYE